MRVVKSLPHKINYTERVSKRAKRPTTSKHSAEEKGGEKSRLPARRMKIKLKKLKMYEVQSSYIVFYLPMAGGSGWERGNSLGVRIGRQERRKGFKWLGRKHESITSRPASFKCKRAVNWYFPSELNLPRERGRKTKRNYLMTWLENSLKTFNLLSRLPLLLVLFPGFG